jgi:tRNA(Ile)-lysidine synthase
VSKVVVLLSGGADSVCLLDVMVREHGAENVTALHVNYGLRDAAAGDERFCEELCERLGVVLEVRSPRRPAAKRSGAGGEGAAPDGRNLQAWARDQRYAEAARLALDSDALVAAGHTASDQVETVLYRLAASPGRRALLGMKAREGRLIRPLLGWTAEQTREYCREHGLPWREDATNASPQYARNRVRHGLVAAMREIHPGAEANVLRTLELLRDEAEVLDAVVAEVATDSVAGLRALPAALRRLVVQHLAGPEAPALSAHADDILALGPEGSAQLDVGGGWRAIVEYGRLRFDREGPGTPSSTTLDAPGEARFGDGRLSAECGPDLPVADGTLDAATLSLPLEIRPWRPGDRMRPLGLGGSRSLQDLFTDRKVPRERRSQLPVVVSAGEIAWVPGVATGEDFKVTAGTLERVRLAWRA